MSNKDPIELTVQVSAENVTDEDIDLMTRQLLSELRELEVESAELTRGTTAPEGTKGDPVTIGSIALAVLPAFLPKVAEFVQAWSLRGQNRIVKFKGRGIEFEGSPEELQKLLTRLEKGKKRK